MKFLVVDVNHINKKVQEMQDKDLLEALNGQVVELYLDQNQENMIKNKIEKKEVYLKNKRKLTTPTTKVVGFPAK